MKEISIEKFEGSHTTTVLAENPPLDPERAGESENVMCDCAGMVEVGRRYFLKRVALAATTAIVHTGTAQVVTSRSSPTYAASPNHLGVNYPSNRLANLKDLKVNSPLSVSYPDSASPGVLLKLGVRVEGGAGSDGDIVGFSTLCPHKGYPLYYNSGSRTLNCPGHYSVYDVEKGGLEVWGHAAQNLAQFKLRVDANTGDIFAEGIDELIYGRTDNILG